MATKRGKAAPSAVASSSWISEERSTALGFVDEGVDEFTYSVLNEINWLNEHMLEVFDENRSWNLAEFMKTPGKLRGKTPRAVRERHPLEVRAPLSEVFGPNGRVGPSPLRERNPARQHIQFEVAEDRESSGSPIIDAAFKALLPTSSQTTKNTQTLSSFETSTTCPTSVSPEPRKSFVTAAAGSPEKKLAPSKATKKTTTTTTTTTTHQPSTTPLGTPAVLREPLPQVQKTVTLDMEPVISYPRFNILQEPQEDPFLESPQMREMANEAREELGFFDAIAKQRSDRFEDDVAMTDAPEDSQPIHVDAAHHTKDLGRDGPSVAPDEMEDVRSGSEGSGSSPVHAIVRKSSLTFASLPAREPLTSKKSVGQRTSQMTHLDGERTTTQTLKERIHQLSQAHPSKAAAPSVTKPTADGPLSASKAKLSSMFQSARGMVARSAGVSAQAKLETLTRPLGLSPSREEYQIGSRAATREIEGERQREVVDLSEDVRMETEHGAALKTVAARSTAESTEAAQRERAAGQTSAPAPATAAAVIPRTKEVRRAIKRPVAKEATVSEPRPAPVAIRVPTASLRTASHRENEQRKAGPAHPPPNTALAASLGQSLAPATAPAARPGGLTKKPSNPSFSSSTSTILSRTNPAGKPKALLLAARRKEQEEKDVQRKLVQKREMEREMERKRTAQQEEDRRREREEAERQREANRAAAMEDPKKAAQRKAFEKRRLELAKKAEQQQKRGQVTAHATGASSKNLPSQTPGFGESVQGGGPGASHAGHRSDLGHGRPMPKLQAASNIRTVPQEETLRPVAQPQLNPARPPKRVLDDFDDDAQQARASTQAASQSQHDSKRRRTVDEDMEEEDELALPVVGPTSSSYRPTMMAPPVRQPSMMRANHAVTQPKMSMFSHGQSSQVAPPSQHHASSIRHPVASTQPANTLRPLLPPTPQALSSPGQAHGSDISLPEIDTDSESASSSPANTAVAASAPSWAESSRLNQILLSQQLIDPEVIFGPIPPLDLENVFRAKERQHRFRARTSSANWSGEDRLTREECESDRRERERVARDGGWSFNPTSNGGGSGSGGASTSR